MSSAPENNNTDAAAAAAPTPTPAVTAAPTAAAAAAAPMAFANDHLLKYNCHDKFSTASKIKQLIQKHMPPPLTQAPPATQLFPGLARVGKNPKSDLVYFSFDTAENRENARKLLTEHMRTRSKQWTEMEVSEHDKSVTHRGATAENNNNNNANNNKESGQRRQREEGQGGGESAGGPQNPSSSDLKTKKTPQNNLAPWSHLPYSTQIKYKEDHCKNVLRIMSKYHTRQTVEAAKTAAYLKKGDPIFDGVIRSPQTKGYRNNVQVTAGYDEDGKLTLGFNAGSVVDGKTAVFPVEHGNITSHPAVSVLVRKMESEVFLPLQEKYFTTSFHQKEDKPLVLMYDKMSQRGFWRRVQFRFNRGGEGMLDVEVNDVQLREELSEEQVKEVMAAVRQSLIDFVKDARTFDVPLPPPEQNEEGKEETKNEDAAPASNDHQQEQKQQQKIVIVSLQMHIYNGTSVAESDCPREVLYGSPTLTETLAGLNFDLSPTDFFQVNRDAMDLLINKIRNVATFDPSKTTLLDLCSGTGTLGLAFAKSVKKIVGIELVSTAVENAKKNAARNGVSNAEYICGRVENELPRVLKQLETLTYVQKSTTTTTSNHNNNDDSSEQQNSSSSSSNPLNDVVAILDPPRCGVPSIVLKALRNTPGLKTLIYISCDQKALETQSEPLTKDKTNQFYGEPFLVDSTFGVDLFPQTNHVEMIVVYKRGGGGGKDKDKDSTQQQQSDAAKTAGDEATHQDEAQK